MVHVSLASAHDGSVVWGRLLSRSLTLVTSRSSRSQAVAGHLPIHSMCADFFCLWVQDEHPTGWGNSKLRPTA